jgi:phospholipid/cholesterol/gamma-HCH transport system substrate-binding protein
MTNSRSTEIKVGIVTLLALVLLIGGIVVGKGLSLSTGKPTLHINFPTASGLKSGDPVYVSGIKRGVVSAVEPSNGVVLVTATLDNLADLKRDASARILMFEVTGDRKVEIQPGQSSLQLVAGNDGSGSATGSSANSANSAASRPPVIQGTTAMDVSELIAFVGDVGTDLRVTLKRLDTTIVEVNELLGDNELKDETRAAIRNLNVLSVNANRLLARNEAELNSALRNLNSLSLDLKRLARKDGPVDTLISRIDTFLVKADTLTTNLNTTLGGADRLIVDLRGIIGDVRTKRSVVNQLLYDEAFARRLDSTLITIKRIFDNLPNDGVNVNVRLGTRP